MLVLSCSDDNDKPKSELEKLPPATQTGEYTFGCLLDGKAFVPCCTGNPLDAVYQYVNGGFYFALQGNKTIGNDYFSIAVCTDSLQIQEGQTYQLKNAIPGNAYGRFFSTGIATFTSDIQNGELTITHLGPQIVSGTFWFDVLDSQDNLRQIREGRFDMEYSN